LREETSPCIGRPWQAATVLVSGGWALANTGKTVPTYSGLHLVPGPPPNPSRA
jgi:hypothetical protein